MVVVAVFVVFMAVVEVFMAVVAAGGAGAWGLSEGCFLSMAE